MANMRIKGGCRKWLPSRNHQKWRRSVLPQTALCRVDGGVVAQTGPFVAIIAHVETTSSPQHLFSLIAPRITSQSLSRHYGLGEIHALIYALPMPDGRLAKIVVRLSYADKARLGRERQRVTANFIQTGGLVEAINLTTGRQFLKLKD
jgi:hypothetical protein